MKKLYPTSVSTAYIVALLLITSLAGCGTSDALMMQEGEDNKNGDMPPLAVEVPTPDTKQSARSTNSLQGRYAEILERDLGSNRNILSTLAMNAIDGNTWFEFCRKQRALQNLPKDVHTNFEGIAERIAEAIQEIHKLCKRNPKLYIGITVEAVKKKAMYLIEKSKKGTAVRRKMNHVFKLAEHLRNVARYAGDVDTANKEVSEALEACKDDSKLKKKIEVLQLVPLLPLDELKCNAELLEFMKERLSSEHLHSLFNKQKIEFYALQLSKAVKAFSGSKLGGELVKHIIDKLRGEKTSEEIVRLSEKDISTILKNIWSADPLYSTFGVSAEALEVIKKHCSGDQPIVRGLREWLRDIIKEDSQHLTLKNIQVAFQGDKLSEDAPEQIVSYVEACLSLCKGDEKRVDEVVELLKLLFDKTRSRLLGTDDDDRLNYTYVVAEIYKCLEKLKDEYSSETASKTLDEIGTSISTAGGEVKEDFKEALED